MGGFVLRFCGFVGAPWGGLCSAALGLVLGAAHGGAWAQGAALVQATDAQPGPAVQLRSSPRLQEALSPSERNASALVLEADRLVLQPDAQTVLQGDVRLRKPGLSVRADHLRYDQSRDQIDAQGQVRVQRMGHVFSGPEVQLQLDSFEGEFSRPRFELAQGGHGDAQRIAFLDEDRMHIDRARYTTCRATPGPEWLPEWLMRASRIRTDMVEGMGHAEGVQLTFLGMTTPELPELRFPLDSRRASGLLAPVVSIDSVSGMDVLQPFYWDIAPHRDATLIARAMSKRGLGAEGEFRYLEPNYSGQVGLNLLPHDSLRKTSRWGLMAQHQARLSDANAPYSLSGQVSLLRVSDDAYWKDFPKTYLGGSGVGNGNGLTQRILPSTGSVSWARGDWSMHALVQRWQTQQDVAAPILPPYDRAPQLRLRYGGDVWQGWESAVTAETTRFEADASRVPSLGGLLRNGTRSVLHGHLRRPMSASWGFVTPKLQWHASRYDMQAPLADGQTTVHRALPTFSLDSGLVLERDTDWLGQRLVQTLEPRIFYVRTAYAQQQMLPLYDTGMTDFNLSTIYSDNPYVGQDRIVDNNAITFGLHSRWFDSATGAERLRMGVAQRLRLADQRVSITNSSTENQKGLSDLLLGTSVRWGEPWSLDSTVQLHGQTHAVQRTTLQARYTPSAYKLINAAYRQTHQNNAPSELVDVGWQWPMGGASVSVDVPSQAGQGLGAARWYSVGRLNYSLHEKRLLETLVGFEYDAGCWLARVAFERLQNTTSAANTRLMFQLELVGFGRVGVSPLDSLKKHIPRYQNLRDTPTQPSRFATYE